MKTLCRITVFCRTGPGPFAKGYAFQAHNADRRMERRMARLAGAGSFYWPSPRAAWRRATIIARAPHVHQVKVETIGGREVGRIYAKGK